jgi:hypothetical protein
MVESPVEGRGSRVGLTSLISGDEAVEDGEEDAAGEGEEEVVDALLDVGELVAQAVELGAGDELKGAGGIGGVEVEAGALVGAPTRDGLLKAR